MTTTRSTAEVVGTYYEVLGGGAATFDPGRLQAILAPDLVFEGPIAGRRVGAEGFIKGVSGFVATATRLELLHQLIDGDAAAGLYDAELPGGKVRFGEFFHVADGRIDTLRLLYDGAAYRSKGGA